MKVIPLRREALELEVTLLQVKPAIWRRLRVARSLTLRDLHHILQIAMGWQDKHLHRFEIDGKRYGFVIEEEDNLDERQHKLSLLQPGRAYRYLYDYGDDWTHELKIVKSVELAAGERLALCLSGAGAAPPEDCGGPPGYLDLLKALKSPRSKRHKEVIDWVGPDYDPEDFDLGWVNHDLEGAGTPEFRATREREYEET